MKPQKHETSKKFEYLRRRNTLHAPRTDTYCKRNVYFCAVYGIDRREQIVSCSRHIHGGSALVQCAKQQILTFSLSCSIIIKFTSQKFVSQSFCFKQRTKKSLCRQKPIQQLRAAHLCKVSLSGESQTTLTTQVCSKGKHDKNGLVQRSMLAPLRMAILTFPANQIACLLMETLSMGSRCKSFFPKA